MRSPGPSPAPCLDSQRPLLRPGLSPRSGNGLGKESLGIWGPTWGYQERNAEVERGGGGNQESLTLETWSITPCFHLFTEHLICASHYPTLNSLSP